jgi:hypothetical protein
MGLEPTEVGVDLLTLLATYITMSVLRHVIYRGRPVALPVLRPRESAASYVLLVKERDD